MREVPRSYLDNYTSALNEVSAKGQEYLSRQLRSIDYSRPISDVRGDLISVMDACCGGASQMAAMESAIFYDGLRERVLGSQMGALAQDMRKPIATEKAVKAFIKSLIEGEYDDFEALCLERLDWEVKAAAGRCTQHNAGRDPFSGETRYARVPTGEETCDFCIMLASRGPIYHSEESAGAYDHYHPHCDCRIVPFWGTYRVETDKGGIIRRSGLMGIEGYDPDAYFEKYLDLATEKFRNRMRTAADKAHEKHGGSWSAGLSRKDMRTLHAHIGAATSYEDLLKRVDAVDNGPYYLTDKQWNELLDHARRKRRELLSDNT